MYIQISDSDIREAMKIAANLPCVPCTDARRMIRRSLYVMTIEEAGTNVSFNKLHDFFLDFGGGEEGFAIVRVA